MEFEAAVISAELTKGRRRYVGCAGTVRESGLGDVEMQVRWRFVAEKETHPEAFTFFETVFPFQRDRHLIGTQDWEYKLGVGLTRGFAGEPARSGCLGSPGVRKERSMLESMRSSI